MYGVFVKAL